MQNSSEVEEVVDTQCVLLIRSVDALRDAHITMGSEKSTPELKVTDGQVNSLGHVDITHSGLSIRQRVEMDSPDNDGKVFMSINNANKLAMTPVGADGYGSLTSNARTK